MKTSSRRVKPLVICLWQDGVHSAVWSLSGLVIHFCNKIRYNKDIGFLCLHSGRIYDNLILDIHTMSIWFWPQNWV
jgi:hypothetical protein